MTGAARIRVARAEELPLILSWAAAEGWNPGIDDAGPFIASDPEGFFVTEVAGQPVAAISVVNHSESFAFLGLYLCLPSHRGQGLGYRLWQHAIGHAGGRVLGLDGVPAQQGNYRKSGFVGTGSTWRYEGAIPAGDAGLVRPVTAGDRPWLSQLEAAANGYAKPAFMEAWAQDTTTRKTLVLAGEAGAFATVRTCGRGAKIGPLVAPDLASAEALLQAIAARVAERPLILDVPDDQTGLAALCKGWGMQAQFNTARMYRGPAPDPGPGIRGVATLELG